MMYVVLFAILALAFWYTLRWQRRRLTRLPGPRGILLLGNMLQIHSNGLRLNMLPWKQKYGDVFRIQLLQKEYVVAASYDAIYEILVSKGPVFGDRPDDFLNRYLRLNTGITFVGPTKTWNSLRKLSHKHLKQYGAGMDKLEEVVFTIAADMLDTLYKQNQQPVDPYRLVRNSTLRIMAYLVTGMKLDSSDELLSMIDEIEKQSGKLFAASYGFHMFVNCFHFLVHLPLNASKDLHTTIKMRQECWRRIKQFQNSHSDSLVQVLLDHKRSAIANKQTENNHCITDKDAEVASIELMEAGTTTTSASFTFLLHIVAARVDIQQRILDEINRITDGKQDHRIQLKHREHMPFTRAVIFETLRLFPPTPNSINHTSLEDTVIQGHIHIPKGSEIIFSLWAVHHDDEFWGDPETIRPERFLDEYGVMLPADHPNRKHVIPFSAGTRVCIGEQFALARLFLLTTAVVQRFRMELSDDTIPNWLDASIHPEDLILRPLPYKVIFAPREDKL